MNKQAKANIDKMKKLSELANELQFLERACQLRKDMILDLRLDCNHDYIFYLGEDNDSFGENWNKYYVCAVCGERELLPHGLNHFIDASNYKNEMYNIMDLHHVEKANDLRRMFQKILFENANSSSNLISDIIETQIKLQSTKNARIRK